MRVQMNLAKRKCEPFSKQRGSLLTRKNYVLTTFEGGSLLHFASYCHSGTFFVCFRNVIKYGKLARISAFYSNLGGNMKPTRVLFVCHGRILPQKTRPVYAAQCHDLQGFLPICTTNLLPLNENTLLPQHDTNSTAASITRRRLYSLCSQVGRLPITFFSSPFIPITRQRAKQQVKKGNKENTHKPQNYL